MKDTIIPLYWYLSVAAIFPPDLSSQILALVLEKEEKMRAPPNVAKQDPSICMYVCMYSARVWSLVTAIVMIVLIVAEYC